MSGAVPGTGAPRSRYVAGDEKRLETWLLERLAELSGLPKEHISPDERFHGLGLDSLALTTLVGELAAWSSKPLAPTAAWTWPTPRELARAVAGDASPARPTDLACGPKAGARRGTRADPVAVVGMAGRFPEAPDVPTLWRQLDAQVDAIREVPADRWDADAWFAQRTGTPGRMSTRWGGFLDDIANFDPRFFGISPEEARCMDPQQRLTLELAWEALEDAGTVPSTLHGRRVGVFMGAMWTTYAALMSASAERITAYSAPGGDLSVISARVAYHLGLRGPAVTVNTACSSSLVAVHQARKAIESGECEAALVGGVNLICGPTETVAMSQFGAMAPDGRCKPFDADADGYVRGEGGGVVLLKPLSRALADGDRVYCTVAGSAVNNDGFSNGLTAPSPQAQEDVIRRACADALVSPSDVAYVETHGTGTSLGDPIEAGALGAVYRTGRSRTRPLLLGAVKSNVGHLEAAAGITGLIKTACILHHRHIPGNLHFRTPSPHIDFDRLGLEVPTGSRPWPGPPDTPAVAGVSSFGFGGTNCHLLLAGHDRPAAPDTRPGRQTRPARREPADEPHQRNGTPRRRAAETAAGPVFVFGGQGSQWPGMAAPLAHDPVVARTLRNCDRAFRPLLGGSLADELLLGTEPLTDTRWIQSAIFTMQVALADRWAAHGVRPAAVIGQSMGEVAAAHVAGAIDLAAAARILVERTSLIAPAGGRGGMALVRADADDAACAIAGLGGSDLGVAVEGAPGRTVVSGSDEDLQVLTDQLADEGTDVHRIDVDYASHSSHMDPFLPDLEAALLGISAGPAHAEFWSTVTGEPLDGTELRAAYWARNLREPVRFGPTLTQLGARGRRVFVDVNPHPICRDDITACAPDAVVVSSLDRHLAADRTWQASRRALADAHLPLGPAVPSPSSAAGPHAGSEPPDADGPLRLLVLSARTPNALAAAAARMARHLSEAPAPDLDAVCHTAGSHRLHHPYRLAVVAADTATASRELCDAADAHDGAANPGSGGKVTRPRKATATGGGEVAVVLPGADDPRPLHAPTLHARFPAFRRVARECADVLAAEGGPDLTAWLAGDAPAAEGDSAAARMFTSGVALTALLRSWGLPVSAATGDGVGLVAAAAATGALTLPDAARTLLALHRSPSSPNGPNPPSKTLGSVARDGRLSGVRPLEPQLNFLDPPALTPYPGLALNGGYWHRAAAAPHPCDPTGVVTIDGRTIHVLDLRTHGPDEGTEESAPGVVRLRSEGEPVDVLLRAVGDLFVEGVEPDWDSLPVPAGGRTRLPAYPWQRSRYWITDTLPEPPTSHAPVADDEAEGAGAGGRERPAGADAIAAFLTGKVAGLLDMAAADVPIGSPPRAVGVNSLGAMQLRNAVVERFGVELPVSRWLGDEALRSLTQAIVEATTEDSTHDTHGPTTTAPEETLL